MKKGIMLVALTAALLVAAATSASAQSGGRGVVADIPFDFQVANETLRAGRYDVSSVTADGAVLRIAPKSEGRGLMTTTIAKRSGRSGHARLVFNKYGDQYFLSEIWEGGTEGRSLVKSKSERRLRRELKHGAKDAVAQADGPEVVVVAARYEAL